jgi:hypothetical protein
MTEKKADACSLTGHDFQPCGYDAQQCDAHCRYTSHLCAMCGKTREELAASGPSVREKELREALRLALPFLEYPRHLTGHGKDCPGCAAREATKSIKKLLSGEPETKEG